MEVPLEQHCRGKVPFRIRRARRSGERGLRAARANDALVVHQEIAQVPVKAQSAVVVLVHFHEASLDGDFRRRDVQGLDRLLDHVQIFIRRVNRQRALAVIEENALRSGQIHAYGIEEIDHGQLDFQRRIQAGHVSYATTSATRTATAGRATLQRAHRLRTGNIKGRSLLATAHTATATTTGQSP